MTTIHRILRNTDACRPFLDRLVSVYATMDERYGSTAEGYGFACSGCEDSCCLTLFHHHALLEYLYLYHGYGMLAEDRRAELVRRAVEVQTAQSAAISAGKTVREMCPLNVDTLCILYAFRPMICRLHGIPYVLNRPGQVAVRGSGCLTFDQRHGRSAHIPFDRTPLYTAMAQTEKELRQAVDFHDRIKMTVADMLAFPE